MPTSYSSFDRLNGKVCFARIYAVDSENRTVSGKTIGQTGGGPGDTTDDLDLKDMQIVHMTWHPEGDEELSLPRIGSYACVIFINSLPLVFGYYPLTITSGEGIQSSREDLLPGDKIIQTIAGNKIIVRSGGTVQIESTKGCRTYWIPSQELINSVCTNFELEPAGGYVHWTLDDNTDDTVMKFMAWDNLEVTTAMTVEVGKPANGTSVLDLAVGPVNTEDMTLSSRNMQMQVDPSGRTEIQIGQASVVIELTPDGAVNLTTTGAITVNGGADVVVNAQGNVNATAGGNAAVKASGNATIDASKIMLNGSGGQVITTETMPTWDLITGAQSIGVTTVLAGS